MVRYAADGSEQAPLDWPDSLAADVVAPVLAPGGTAYFARRDPQLQRDTLWRVPPSSPVAMPVDLGCCVPAEVRQLAALPDDGLVVAMQSGYGGTGRLRRYASDGSLLWQGDAVEAAAPGFEILALTGDRAGRVLTVSTEPGYVDPVSSGRADPSRGRSIALHVYDATGSLTGSRLVTRVRFDEGSPIRLAVTSDDRAVLAFNGYDTAANSGIHVQIFGLGNP
jgi:hypothetical protein